ncbi:MAG: hypothetical protein CMN84_04725 [Spongiibacteraceae bacterium]|jgi:TM2 domain-containing membrane protein YozV|nr:hypothetical protein [Spongiibacteraceae bacterium]|tara:strand:+ start:393 stop:839 length:447 start_codon:yes stop_codon:yes gene_type:complete
MKGVVLDFNEDTSRGIIAADDGRRYEFAGINWLSERYPGSGMHVDFEAQDERAENIYLDPCLNKIVEKDRMAAALLAFFFGWLGFHKFYLGHKQPATIMLCVSLGGLLLLAIPTLVMMVIGFIEFIIYVTCSDEAFDRVYIHGNRDWF